MKFNRELLEINELDEPSLNIFNGGLIRKINLAYETYGDLNTKKDNVILLFHALTGSQHAAGKSIEGPGLIEGDNINTRWNEEMHLGWWDGFIGPGKALDTNKFFVLSINYIGSCYGSTGPASFASDGKRYGSRFPEITLSDIVDSQISLLRRLKISNLHAVIGASIGGMMCLSLSTRYPGLVKNVIPIAAGINTTPLQRILNLEQAFAIETDPNFNEGNYYDSAYPNNGLALARMIGHKTFVSLNELENRAKSGVIKSTDAFTWYKPSSEIESYMLHQGKQFTERFDANSYLRLLDAWQRFDLVGESNSKTKFEVFNNAKQQKFLIFSIDSDVCYYPEQQYELSNLLEKSNVHYVHITVHSKQGHDSFLLEPNLFTPHIKSLLENEI